MGCGGKKVFWFFSDGLLFGFVQEGGDGDGDFVDEEEGIV